MCRFANCSSACWPCAPIIHVNIVSVWHINVPGDLADPPTNTLSKTKTPQKGCLCFGGSGWIRTTSGLSQQIYSLPRLSNSGARPELFCGLPHEALAKCGAGSGTRTRTSSLEGLRTSPCTMPAINRKRTDYIPI